MKQENSTLIDQNSDKSSENGYSAFTPITEEETLKQQNSRKKELIAGAIGDGVNAFANLFFASKGAPISHSKGKEKMPTLYDRIYGRHKKEDDIYNSNLNAWEKEQEKKRNEEKRQAKLNARETDIHPDFTPLKSQWNSKDYIATVFDDFKAELSDHLKKKGIKSNHMVTELDSFISSASDRSRPYHMQSALAEILEGDLENFQDNSKNELDEYFLKYFRKKWMDNETQWEKMK